MTRCVEATGAELVVLPESVTTGFTPGIGPERALGPGVRGPRARSSSRCRRPPAGSACTSSSAPTSAGRSAASSTTPRCCSAGTATVAGVYRKTHPFCTEMRSRGGWVTPGRRGQRRRDRPRPDRADHLLRRRLPRAVPDHRGPRRRGDRAAVRAAALGGHLGAHQPGPGLRQPRLRRGRQRHRHRPRRGALLRQLDGGHPGRRGGRAGSEPRVLGQRPARPGHRDVRRSRPGRACRRSSTTWPTATST